MVFPSQLLSGIFDLGFFMEPLNQFFNIVNHLPAPVYRFQILSLWLVLPLFLICFSFKLRDLKQKKGLLLFSLSFLVALLMAKPSNLKPKARAYILDVGHGDAIFLQNSKGKWLLWDTGINRYSRSISRFLFTQKTEKSLGILISHSDLDHYGGAHEISKALKIPVYLEKLAYFKVANKSFKIINSEFREKLKNEFGLHIYPRPQMAWLSDNNLSMVANFKLKTKNILLPGDLEWKGEEIVRPNPAEVLILGHHGSKTSTGKEWLEKVNPKLAIHSGKAKDLHPIVKKRVLSKKIKIYSTANLGSIELSESKTGEIIIKMP